jgi:serine/threonine-protein kinase
MSQSSPPEAVTSPARRSIVPIPPRYEVMRHIGTGGMASIWAAQDQVLGRWVAIKVLADNLAEQPRFVERFEREARLAASLSGHSNVITIYDVGEHEGRPFIVMEYLSGGTVADRLRSGRRPTPAEAVRWLRETASALDYVHQQGVLHRDVKPQNLLFDERGRLVVGDLGIARAAFESRLTTSGELFGTAAYMAPEQVDGDPGSPASDRYSLAVVAFELLTGALPFAGGNMAEQARHKLEDEPFAASSVAPGLPPAVDSVLSRALSREPRERWPSACKFVDELEQALGTPAATEDPEDTVALPVPPSDSAEAPEPVAPPRPLGAPPAVEPQPVEPLPVEPRWDIRRPRVWPRVLAVVLLVAALGGIALAAGALSGGGDKELSLRDRREARREAAQTRRQERARRERSSSAAPAQSSPPAAPSPATPAGGSPATLNDRGFALMQNGRYSEAVPVLQRAVAGYPAGSTDLGYAYALYNLARSLRLAGRPAEAIPYLEKRLKFANQRGVVKRELAAARRAAGG